MFFALGISQKPNSSLFKRIEMIFKLNYSSPAKNYTKSSECKKTVFKMCISWLCAMLFNWNLCLPINRLSFTLETLTSKRTVLWNRRWTNTQKDESILFWVQIKSRVFLQSQITSNLHPPNFLQSCCGLLWEMSVLLFGTLSIVITR